MRPAGGGAYRLPCRCALRVAVWRPGCGGYAVFRSFFAAWPVVPAGGLHSNYDMNPSAPNPGADVTSAGGLRLVLVLALLSTFAPFATDMYLPAFAQMVEAYHTDHGRIEATLSTFFLGLALGQAIYGPIIDRFGRKVPLMIGVSLFGLATLGCLLTRNIDVFTSLRLLQAIGGCAGMIIGRAIVRDLYGPRESARVLSLMMMLMTLAPIMAPLLGGWIVSTVGWQAIFYFLLAFATVCWLLVLTVIPETLPGAQRASIAPRAVLGAYAALLKRRDFIVPALAGGLAQASMFAFITGSPFVFMGRFGFSEQQYSFVFGGTALGLMVGAQLNRLGLRRFSVPVMLSVALCVSLSAALALFCVADTDQPFVLMVPMWFVVATIGMIGANAAAIAMGASGQHAGTASALIGVLQFSCAFTVSSLVAVAQNGTAYPMATAMLCAALCGSLLWFAGSRPGKGRAEQ